MDTGNDPELRQPVDERAVAEQPMSSEAVREALHRDLRTGLSNSRMLHLVARKGKPTRVPGMDCRRPTRREGLGRTDVPPSHELVVIDALRDWACTECGENGSLLIMENAGPLCMTCADLDDLVFLPRGTRRSPVGRGRQARFQQSWSDLVARDVVTSVRAVGMPGRRGIEKTKTSPRPRTAGRTR